MRFLQGKTMAKNFKSDHFQSTEKQIQKAFHDALDICSLSSKLIGSYFEKNLDIKRSERFWKIVLHKFLIKFSQDIIAIRSSELKDQTEFSDKIIIPYDDHTYSNLRHNNSQFYSQFFREIDFNLGSDVMGFKEMPFLISVKTSLKNLLFKWRLSLSDKNKILPILKDYYPAYWNIYFSNLKLLFVKYRGRNFPLKYKCDNINRQGLFEWLVEGGMPIYLARCLSFSLPYNLFEQFKINLNSVQRIIGKNSPNIIYTSWFPDLGTAILYALWVEKGAKFHITQHGGGPGEDPFSMGEVLEKSFSDVYYGWTQKTYSSKVHPVCPPRLIAFRKSYENFVKANLSTLKKDKFDLLILDSMHYQTPTFGDFRGNLGSKENIFTFLDSYKNGDGKGVCLRLYKGNYAKNDEFESSLRLKYPLLSVNDQSVALHKNLYESQKVVMNLRYSTARWEAASIGKEVKVLFSEQN